MKKPVIGISCYVEPAKWGAWDIQAAVLPFAYVTSVTEAGGRAVIIPPDSTGSEVVENLDGLIIAGGADVDAALYSESAHETADKPRVERNLALPKSFGIKKTFLRHLSRIANHGSC